MMSVETVALSLIGASLDVEVDDAVVVVVEVLVAESLMPAIHYIRLTMYVISKIFLPIFMVSEGYFHDEARTKINGV